MKTQFKALAFSLLLLPGVALSADEDNLAYIGIHSQAVTTVTAEMEVKDGMAQINSEISQQPTAAGNVYKNALFPVDGFHQLGDL